jgi:alpha-L-rhamnosidase
MNSFAHYAFGAVCEWMFTSLAGIDTDGAGYKHLLIKPMPPSPGSNPEHEPIAWVRAQYDSIHGRIATAWKVSAAHFDLDIVIPPNTDATVYLPMTAGGKITESGRDLERSRGIKVLRQEGDRTVLSVESGHYQFETAR